MHAPPPRLTCNPVRIFISDRRDITSLLNKLSDNTPTLDATNVAIGVIPLRPPLEDPTRVVHEEGDEVEKGSQSSGTDSTKSISAAALNIDPSSATVGELFTHGTVARIVGLEGGRAAARAAADMPDDDATAAGASPGALAIVVEGVSRFAVEQFRQRTPWIEADVQHFVDEPIAADDERSIELFLQVKALSRELVTLLRTNSARGVGLPPVVARRLEIMIARRDVNDAGLLADFMVSAVETTFPERLGYLAAVAIPERLEKAVAILARQVDTIKAVAAQRRNSQMPPAPHLVVVDHRRGSATTSAAARARARRGAMAGMGGDDEDDDDEVEELAKVLREAGLSPEADKVARRELLRLKRMSPVQAEYGVCRTYLETLAEVCVPCSAAIRMR